MKNEHSLILWSVSPVCLSKDVLVSHLSSRNLARSASPPGLFSGRGSRNLRNILWALEVSSLKSLGLLTGIRTPLLPCQCRYRTYRGSSLPAFCQGRQPVRHTNITIPNCHTSCDVSALQHVSCRWSYFSVTTLLNITERGAMANICKEVNDISVCMKVENLLIRWLLQTLDQRVCYSVSFAWKQYSTAVRSENKAVSTRPYLYTRNFVDVLRWYSRNVSLVRSLLLLIISRKALWLIAMQWLLYSDVFMGCVTASSLSSLVSQVMAAP